MVCITYSNIHRQWFQHKVLISKENILFKIPRVQYKIFSKHMAPLTNARAKAKLLINI